VGCKIHFRGKIFVLYFIFEANFSENKKFGEHKYLRRYYPRIPPVATDLPKVVTKNILGKHRASGEVAQKVISIRG